MKTRRAYNAQKTKRTEETKNKMVFAWKRRRARTEEGDRINA